MERQGVLGVDVSESSMYVYIYIYVYAEKPCIRASTYISVYVCMYRHAHTDTQSDCKVSERSRP